MKKNRIIPMMIIAVATLMAVALIAGCSGKTSGTAGSTTSPSAASSIPDGTFTGEANGFAGPLKVQVSISGGKIADVKLLELSDSDFSRPAVDTIINQAKSKGTADALDVVAGASFTSKGVIAAIQNAIAIAKGEAAPVSSLPAAVTTNADVVVIGAGGAGLSAATQAALLGAKVIVLEKMPIAGGNTNYATGGLNASETSVQAKLGIQDSNQSFYDDTMKGGQNINDPALVDAMVINSAETVDWLLGLGADLTDVGKMAGSSNSRTHRPAGGAAVGGHLVEVLVQSALDSGAEIRYNSKVITILKAQDGTNTVAGVRVQAPNGTYLILAPTVVLATGGFGANPDLLVSLKPGLEGFGTTNHSGATGDAFDLVKPFSVALVDMEQIQTHPTVVPVQNLMITEAVRGNGAIMVNREGKRFNSEMATRDVMSSAILEQTGKTAYLLFDHGVRESLKAIETYYSQGLLTEGATVSELAGKLGMPAAALEETITTYNGYVANGADPDFGRKADEMPRSLATGPYYAVEVGPAVHHTMGGVKITPTTHVLDTSGVPVAGLFAAGEVVGGVHGANRLGGNAVADITVFGKIAGEQAATLALSQK
ncbi:flavocytochrome c [Parasphaerochaeta coccoides]|uniref:Urocanate reductase n=1 Tax=Parasphaerochaeta coccoides (strain ATCC BAA-1237 / DSM 17374 / SPN1) TaxID=760011 RepID=F4GHP2_PARC1|nr:flavocytochrome c [Parasphaerochaeta coccoides]AEC01580.1 flavocytochrome c [Parasphaerochaeta coccoides DSM 17374]